MTTSEKSSISHADEFIDQIAQMFRSVAEQNGLTDVDIAERANLPVEVVRQCLSGTYDIDLCTITDLSWGLGCRPGIEIELRSK